MSKVERFCVFCGEPPIEKNREHILPRWLLEMTGDPNRVVNMGWNFATGTERRFAFSQFTFPACQACNSFAGNLEEIVKPIMEKLTARATLTVLEYHYLLDWLDKVRVGMWLAYYYLDQNPLGLRPTFHIADRVCKKDRMLAVYTLDGSQKGLSTIGINTLIFRGMPSCFGLIVNGLLLFNMSYDFLISARAGFPFPRRIESDLDNGGLRCTEWDAFSFVKSPLIRKPIHKPVVLLYQPVFSPEYFQLGSDLYKQDYVVERRLAAHLPTICSLYRERGGRTELLQDVTAPVEFVSVTGKEWRYLWQLQAQILDFQIFLQQRLTEFTCADPVKFMRHQQIFSESIALNQRLIKNLAAEQVNNPPL